MKEKPLVLCVTNSVATNFTANCLLAMGAKPAMLEEPSDIEEFAALADAALINIGTVHARSFEAMRVAVRALAAYDKPWVLDPVAGHLLSYRRQCVRELLAARPAIVRGNQDEMEGLGISGVVTLATGDVDRVTRATGEVHTISGGVKMLQTVTATGCAQGAICAAFLGRGYAPFEAAVAASELMKRAGERAWAAAKTPGSFQIALIDALFALSN